MTVYVVLLTTREVSLDARVWYSNSLQTDELGSGVLKVNGLPHAISHPEFPLTAPPHWKNSVEATYLKEK